MQYTVELILPLSKRLCSIFPFTSIFFFLYYYYYYYNINSELSDFQLERKSNIKYLTVFLGVLSVTHYDDTLVSHHAPLPSLQPSPSLPGSQWFLPPFQRIHPSAPQPCSEHHRHTSRTGCGTTDTRGWRERRVNEHEAACSLFHFRPRF